MSLFLDFSHRSLVVALFFSVLVHSIVLFSWEFYGTLRVVDSHVRSAPALMVTLRVTPPKEAITSETARTKRTVEQPIEAVPEDIEPTPTVPVVLDSSYHGSRPAPRYPKRALRLGQEGTVLVLVQFGRYGDLDAVRVLQSSGYPLLDKAAVDAVKQWDTIEASLFGHEVHVPISFQLNEY